jgi:PAS domain S-box-containing protein
MPASETPATPTPGKAARILLAEDEGLIAEELRDRLESLGHEVVDVVAAGEEAIRVVGLSPPDLVLMDIRLAGRMDGIEAAAEIGSRFEVPVVYLTAHSDAGTIQRAKRTAPLGYLVKPVEEQELRITVEMALHKAELERRLRESEQRYATTLTSIGDAVIATDPDGRVTFLNPVAEGLTRWSRADALGVPVERVFRIVDAVTRQALESPVAKSLREDGIVVLPNDTILLARDGAEVHIDDSAAPIRDRNRQVRGVVLVFRDISGQKQAEAAVRKAEEQLRQAQKMEAIGRLAGGVAHDINNLMTVVTGFGDLVLGQLPADHPARDMVREMKQAGDRAATVTRQLLAFSRRQMLQPVVLDLNRVVTGTAAMLRHLIGAEVSLRSVTAPDLVPVKADPNQLEQVVVNLAVNARDAMPHGGELTLETRTVSVAPSPHADALAIPPGEYALLTVTDTGVGMDVITCSQVFEPFFTTKGVGKGTGLGLATVYGIVKQSGGHIEVESDLGRGTTFRIYLPRSDDARAAEVELSPAIRRGAETILLVDDDDAVRAVTLVFLRGWGYTVLEAADAAEGLALCERHPSIALLLTDAIMPVMSGRELAQRATALRPGLRVLFMSGYTEDYVLRHEVQAAAVAFLQKPFTPSSLSQMVRQVIDG